MKKTEFTHKGWFGVCPVYYADLAGPAPMVAPRHWVLTPLLWGSEAMFAFCFALQGLVDPLSEPAWPLRVTGKLKEPKFL